MSTQKQMRVVFEVEVNSEHFSRAEFNTLTLRLVADAIKADDNPYHRLKLIYLCTEVASTETLMRKSNLA